MKKFWKIITVIQVWLMAGLIVFFAHDIWHLRDLKRSVENLTSAIQQVDLDLQEKKRDQKSDNEERIYPDLDQSKTELITTLNKLEKKITSLEKRQIKLDAAKVIVTAYTPCVEECDSDPDNTAIMTKPEPGTIAISRDLLEAGWTFGKRVWIKNHGVFVINDLMNKRHSKRIDLVMLDKKQAIEFGKQELLAVLIH